MKYYFLDSSALVYLYAPGAEAVRDLVGRAARRGTTERVVICDISLPEIAYDLIEFHKQGRLKPELLARTIERMERDINAKTSPFVVAEVSGAIHYAVELMRLYQLSSPSAVALATAIAARSSMPANSDIFFVSTDEEQLSAAGAENFTTYRPYELP